MNLSDKQKKKGQHVLLHLFILLLTVNKSSAILLNQIYSTILFNESVCYVLVRKTSSKNISANNKVHYGKLNHVKII